MEKSEISQHEVSVYRQLLERPEQWMTAKEIAEAAQVAPRTARAHCLKLVRLGVLDQAELFPQHRYRFSKLAAKRNVAYLQRLKFAAEVFGGK